jgi:hypothetical protein
VSRTARALAALVTVLVAVAAGCTKELPSRSSPGDVQRRVGSLGTPVNMFGVETTVIGMEPFEQSVDGFPRLRVTLRTRSRLEVPWENPQVSIRCQESDEPGEWYDGSTWESQGILPGGRVLEGQIILGFPPKPEAERYPVPTCTDAAVVVTGSDPQRRQRQVVASFPIPDEMVQAAIDAPRS